MFKLESLGRGVRVPFSADTDTGKLSYITGEELLSQDIRRLVLLPLGDRPRREYLGTLVNELPFTNLTAGVTPRFSRSVENAIVSHEYRAKLLKIKTTTGSDTGRVRMTVTYGLSSQFLRTHQEFSTEIDLPEADNVF